MFSILISYGNVIYRPFTSLTTGNAIKHSVQYLNHEVDIMFKDIGKKSMAKKSANCQIKVAESIKIAKFSYFIVYLE